MKIKASLSASSISDAVDALRKYAESLNKKSETLVRKLCEKGVERANLYLQHDDTGETRNSISYVQEGLSGTVSVGGAAVWIEFGTGVIANAGNSPHPMRDAVGAFAWGQYGDGHGSDPNGWWYFHPQRGLQHTNGIEMNPFMYPAAQDLHSDLTETAREVFKND